MELKEKMTIIKNRIIIITGFLLIIIGIFIYIFNLLSINIVETTNEKKIEEFINVQIKLSPVISNADNIASNNEQKITESKENYIAVIEIPKINLKEGIYSKDSKLNNVDKNIKLLKESDMPDIEKGNMILAGHSGTGRTAFFNNLIELEKADVVNIYYNNYKYSYKVINMYSINKTGKISLNISNSKSRLILITCDMNDKTKQLVFICEQN